MPYWTYILRSLETGRHYCGHTNDMERRLKQHNDPEYRGTKTTKRFKGPWVLIWKEEHTSRSDAMLREKQIKRWGIKKFIEAHPA